MKSRQLALLIFSLMIVPNVGCQSWYRVRDTFYFCEPIDEAIHGFNCHCAARKAWKARYHLHCERSCADHFGHGFRAGYADVMNGGTGCPPPLPPRSYWGWRYQNCEGQQCVAGWFDGYPAGARAAEEDGVSNWSRMQTSYLIDAQYAARMNGNRRGGPLPPGAGFPGEVLEEVPAAPISTSDAGATGNETPIETPVGPSGSTAPETDATQDLGSIRKFTEPTRATAKITDEPILAQNSVPVQEPELRRLGTPAYQASVNVKKLEMPVVEMLSGVSVPKKQLLNVQAVPEVDIQETTPIEMTDESADEDGDELAMEEPAKTPEAAPIVVPVLRRLDAPSTGVIAETTEYSLSDEVETPARQKTSALSAAKRALPPIVPSKAKKAAPPIVRPLDENGRLTGLENKSQAKQVSFQGEPSEEIPALRRIGNAN